jgi:hypothetical protein
LAYSRTVEPDRFPAVGKIIAVAGWPSRDSGLLAKLLIDGIDVIGIHIVTMDPRPIGELQCLPFL